VVLKVSGTLWVLGFVSIKFRNWSSLIFSWFVSCCKVLSGIVRYCQLLSVLSGTVRYCQVLSVAVRYCHLLSGIVRYCQVLSGTVRYCQVFSGTVRCCQVLSGTVMCCQVLSGTVRCCQLLLDAVSGISKLQYFCCTELLCRCYSLFSQLVSAHTTSAISYCPISDRYLPAYVI